MPKECERTLEQLKKDYEKIQKKYNLPSFRELNEDFQIEKICEEQTDYLIREVRKFMADKFSNYMRFIEAIIHPVNSPVFIFSVIKTLSVEDKRKLEEIYKKLAKNEINLVEVDIDFSEEKEAGFIRSSYKIWQEIKKDILDEIKVIKSNWDSKLGFNTNNKGYFG